MAIRTEDWFETRTREDGESFVVLRDGAPDWVRDVVFDCHDGMLPDDWTYATVAAVFDRLAECAEYEEEPDAHDVADSLVDVYTSDLMAWAPGHTDDIDEATEEYGLKDVGIVSTVRHGQYNVILRMAERVIEACENET